MALLYVRFSSWGLWLYSIVGFVALTEAGFHGGVLYLDSAAGFCVGFCLGLVPEFVVWLCDTGYASL